MISSLRSDRFWGDFSSVMKVQASLLVLGIPFILACWVWIAQQWVLDVRWVSRSALLCCVPVLLLAIFYPFLTRFPDKKLIFITAWFVIAMFFNLWWEMPQVVFMSVFKQANQQLNIENLPYFIAWWGYTTSDLDYFHLTRYFILAEISFWVVNLLAVVGLWHLYKGREFLALLWFCICGALQVYNVVCIFLPYGGIVEQFQNIATDSPLALCAYWIMNLMWVLAAAVATVLSYRCLRQLAKEQAIK